MCMHAYILYVCDSILVQAPVYEKFYIVLNILNKFFKLENFRLKNENFI